MEEVDKAREELEASIREWYVHFIKENERKLEQVRLVEATFMFTLNSKMVAMFSPQSHPSRSIASQFNFMVTARLR